jgi:prophage regulatory protein
MLMLDLYSMSANPNPKTILRVDEVLRRTGLKRTMLYDLIGKGSFPAQFSLGARAVGWYEDKVEEWIRSRESAKRQPERSGQVVTDGKEMLPAPQPPRRGVWKAAALNTSQPKRPIDPAATPFMARTPASGRIPTHSVKTEDDIAEMVSESGELRLLRKENVQLKKLVGELVLKNSLLQSSAGLKASAI